MFLFGLWILVWCSPTIVTCCSLWFPHFLQITKCISYQWHRHQLWWGKEPLMISTRSNQFRTSKNEISVLRQNLMHFFLRYFLNNLRSPSQRISLYFVNTIFLWPSYCNLRRSNTQTAVINVRKKRSVGKQKIHRFTWRFLCFYIHL